ncbi:uncharacterized protein A4U43_C04F12360 [Asparagus officinalis]|uniref:Uncharacterized protein n=1 Tax=Asparagus officinalis TaxID=4686 RepID=A0A5P1F0B4_ASPOF|nr:uncharacterized protein A4U43_C04F12360 [Asparagus officinalis]
MLVDDDKYELELDDQTGSLELYRIRLPSLVTFSLEVAGSGTGAALFAVQMVFGYLQLGSCRVRYWSCPICCPDGFFRRSSVPDANVVVVGFAWGEEAKFKDASFGDYGFVSRDGLALGDRIGCGGPHYYCIHSWGPSGVLEAGGGDDVDEEGRRAPTMPPRPEKGKLRHGWRGATWQSERAWKESGRTWTREVERMTPAAKDLIRVRVLGEEGEFLKRRERVTGAEIAGGS